MHPVGTALFNSGWIIDYECWVPGGTRMGRMQAFEN